MSEPHPLYTLVSLPLKWCPQIVSLSTLASSIDKEVNKGK